MSEFLLAVLSLPGVFSGEVDCMEALLGAGVERLHLRKPEATPEELEELLQELAPRWGDRLVLHGPRSREWLCVMVWRMYMGRWRIRMGRGIPGAARW